MFAPSLLVDSNPTIGLSSMFAKNEDGLITCTMTRQNSMPGTSKYFELSRHYNIMFAYGDLLDEGEQMQYHRLRTISSHKFFV